MRLDVDQTPGARQRRVVPRRLGHLQVQKRPQTQRIRHPPRNPPLRRQALEIPDEQHPEILPRTQTRLPHPRRVEHRAQSLNERVKPSLIQDPVQTRSKNGCPAFVGKSAVVTHSGDPCRAAGLLRIAMAVQCTGFGRAGARPVPRLSPRAARRGAIRARPAESSMAVFPSSPWQKAPLHSTGDASRLTALFLGRIWPICSLVTPCQPGASPVSVRRGVSPRAARELSTRVSTGVRELRWRTLDRQYIGSTGDHLRSSS